MARGRRAAYSEPIAGPDGAANPWKTPSSFHREEFTMLHYTVVFLVIALIAALLGFGGIAAGAAGIAKILFLVFLIMAVASFVADLLRKR